MNESARTLLRGTIVNRTYGTDKTYTFIYFYQQYLVLFTMVARNSLLDVDGQKKRFDVKTTHVRVNDGRGSTTNS